MEPRRPGRGATAAQLKADTERGRFGDKVPMSDPGLAPLGTDEEAAGTPTSPEAMAAVRHDMARIASDRGTVRSAEPWPPDRSSKWTIGRILQLTACLAIAVLALGGLFGGLWQALGP